VALRFRLRSGGIHGITDDYGKGETRAKDAQGRGQHAAKEGGTQAHIPEKLQWQRQLKSTRTSWSFNAELAGSRCRGAGKGQADSRDKASTKRNAAFMKGDDEWKRYQALVKLTGEYCVHRRES